jgi:ribose transport system substrate-binding protein
MHGVCGVAMLTTVLVASACSSSGGSSTAAAGSGSSSCSGANKTLHVAFVGATSSQNPMQEMAEGAKAAATEDGHTKIQVELPPDVDAAKEVSMLQSVTRTATDGIAWESVDPDQFVRPLLNVKKAGIPLVAVDNMTPEGVKPDLLVSNSNYENGVKLGQAFAAQKPNPNGTVVIGNDIPTLSVLQDRIKGLEHVIKSKFPHMKIVGPFDAKGAGGVAKDTPAWEAQIHAHPDAVGFIGVGGPDGVSLPLIKKKTHGKWLAGAADISPQALNGVKNGYLFALSSPEHFMKGYIAVHEIIKQDRTCKKMPSGWWNSGTLLINKKNVDSVIARQKNNKTRLAWFQKHAIPQHLKNPPLKPYSDLS